MPAHLVDWAGLGWAEPGFLPMFGKNTVSYKHSIVGLGFGLSLTWSKAGPVTKWDRIILPKARPNRTGLWSGSGWHAHEHPKQNYHLCQHRCLCKCYEASGFISKNTTKFLDGVFFCWNSEFQPSIWNFQNFTNLISISGCYGGGGGGFKNPTQGQVLETS